MSKIEQRKLWQEQMNNGHIPAYDNDFLNQYRFARLTQENLVGSIVIEKIMEYCLWLEEKLEEKSCS